MPKNFWFDTVICWVRSWPHKHNVWFSTKITPQCLIFNNINILFTQCQTFLCHRFYLLILSCFGDSLLPSLTLKHNASLVYAFMNKNWISEILLHWEFYIYFLVSLKIELIPYETKWGGNKVKDWTVPMPWKIIHAYGLKPMSFDSYIENDSRFVLLHFFLNSTAQFLTLFYCLY